MISRAYYDANHAYHAMLDDLLEVQQPLTVRGELMSSELLSVTVRITDASRPIITLPERKLNYKLMLAEALWNLVPLSYNFMRKFNKRADVFVSDQPEESRTHARWHYGHVLSKEIPRVVRELRKDANTRRAAYTLPQVHPSVSVGTPPCLMGQQFLYRDGALHCITTMRSTDAWLGLPLDIFQFMFFQHLVAAGAGLPVGSFTLQTASLHLYGRDLQGAEEVAATRRIGTAAELATPITNRAFANYEQGRLHRLLEAVESGHAVDAYICGDWAFFIGVLTGDNALYG